MKKVCGITLSKKFVSKYSFLFILLVSCCVSACVVDHNERNTNYGQKVWVENHRQEISAWVNAVGKKVRHAWVKESDDTAICSVYVHQSRDGNVNEAKVKSCEGNASDAYKRSIEMAVKRASPLPKALSDEIFTGELIFIFRPN